MRNVSLCILAAVLLCIPMSRLSAQDSNGSAGSGPMVVQGGKLYVVSGTTLACVNLKTYEVEFKKDLTLIGKEKAEAEAMEKRKAYLANFDKNNDGKVTEDEAGRSWRWLSRQDKSKDGSITADELTMYTPRTAAAYGNASLMVSSNVLFMLRSGNLFVFDKASLDFQKSVVIEEKKVGEGIQGMPYGNIRQGGRTNRNRTKPQGGANPAGTQNKKKTEKKNEGQAIF